MAILDSKVKRIVPVKEEEKTCRIARAIRNERRRQVKENIIVWMASVDDGLVINFKLS